MPKRLGRPLLGIVVAYAVAAQSLLLALGGFALPAPADTGAPAFELCLHDGQAAPGSSDGDPKPFRLHALHLLFCRIASRAWSRLRPALFHRVDVEIVDVAMGDAISTRLPRFSANSIANPRGPPLRRVTARGPSLRPLQ